MRPINLSTNKLKAILMFKALLLAVLLGIISLFYIRMAFSSDEKLYSKIFLIFIALAFAVFGVERLIRTIKIPSLVDDMHAELAYYYPELEDNLSGLNASPYADTTMKVLVYGHHLIAYHRLKVIDLERCILVTYTLKRHKKGFVNTYIAGKLLDASYLIVEASGFPFYNQEAHCKELMSFIEEEYDIDVIY